MPTLLETQLPDAEWRARQAAHRARVLPWVEGFRARRARAQAHPVNDFLFTYYSFRPGQLLRWSPGYGVALDDPEGEFTGRKHFVADGACAALDIKSLPTRTEGLVCWIGELMERVASSPGRFGCFGLHEWAMVYRMSPEEIRHAAYPLRLSPDEVAGVVESGPLCCTHHDAFRFFTPEARPLNAFQPTMDSRMQMEQPGCLHTNMDLYKWAYKLSPWVPSELVGDAFEFACRIRELDMRASPYDLRDLGYQPIEIETAAGRSDYERQQREFAAESAPIRERLLACCHKLDGSLEK